MAQWVVLQPIFEVCSRKKGYKGGGGGGQEGRMVSSGDSRNEARGNLGGYLAGGQYKAVRQKGHTVGYRRG